MEKTPIVSSEPVTQNPVSGAREKDLEAHGIKRKPVPLAPTYTFVERENLSIQTRERYQRDAPLPLPPQLPKTPFAGLRRRWQRCSRRTRIVLIATLSFVLLLIIILPAAIVSASKNRTSDLPLPTSDGGPYTGDLTYYDPALGACGITSDSSDYIVAVSHIIFDAVSTSSDPNTDPLCGKKIRAKIGDKSADVTVVDRCVGCKADDLDVTSTVFTYLTGDLGLGRVTVSWSWLDTVPGPAQDG